MTRSRLVYSVTAVSALMLPSPARPAQHQAPHHPDHMERKFDAEESTKSFDDPSRDEWQMPSRVIEALALRPDGSVADIGAGTGYFSMRLSKAVPRGVVYAVDIEPGMLEFIGKRAAKEGVANVVPVKAAASSPNLPKPVDVILIVNTYHHLPNRRVYFKDLQRSLANSGTVAIVDYRKNSPSGPPVEFRFEVEQIVGEMKAAGFRLEAQHDFLPRQNFLVFRPVAADR